jgi:hypothetical protein
MILNIDGEIDQPILDKLVQFYNQDSDEFQIYFSSNGGITSVAEAIIDLINKNGAKTTLIAYNEILSSAFSIFFKSNCKKTILDETIGMYHQATQQLFHNERGLSTPKDQFLRDQLTLDRKKSLKFINDLDFNNKEKKLYNLGQDVWFNTTRLRNLLSANK